MNLQSAPSFRERIVDHVRADIMLGKVEAGQVYSAPTLAEIFGVSVTPVREALLVLVREGQLEIVRNKGFRVTTFTPGQLDNMVSVRILLEAPTVAAIARNHDKRQATELLRLRGVADKLVTLAEAGDVSGYVELDRAFHLDLLSLAGNDELVRIVADLRAKSRIYGLGSTASHELISSTAKEHPEIIDLVLACEGEKVADLIRIHIGHVRAEWA